MLPVNSGSHPAYQDFVLENLCKYYPNPDSIARSTWNIIERFWNLVLSFMDEFMRDKYSVFGPKPRTPSCMQCSYLLSIDFKVSSLTDWSAQLKINPLYAILSGFEFGDTPGVGTFYDFLNRMWDSDDSQLSSHIHPLKVKVKKPKNKGAKADSVEKIKVEQLLLELENTAFVTVRWMAFRIANVTDFFPSLIVISVGTLPKTVGIMAMIYICLLHRIRKVIFLFFLS